MPKSNRKLLALPSPIDGGSTRAVVAVKIAGDILKAKNVGEALRKMPAALDGSRGLYRNRVDPNLTGADTDVQAIEVWIKARAGTAHTRRLYKREAHRFLLWALAYKQKQLGDIGIDDVGEFESWLAKSEPGDNWPPCWRVFSGKKLSATSRGVAMNVLQGLYTFLRLTGYLSANPFLGVRRGQTEEDVQARQGGDALDKEEEPPLERYFEPDLWAWIEQRLEKPYSPEDWPDYEHVINPGGEELTKEEIEQKKTKFIPGKRQTVLHKWSRERVERLRFIVLFGYWTGARRSELAAANMASIAPVRKKNVEYWTWTVAHGKGMRKGEQENSEFNKLVLGDVELAALMRYRESRNLSPLPKRREPKIPLIARLQKEGREAMIQTESDFMKDTQLNHELKVFFRQCAERAQREGKPELWGERLAHASAHWLRHSLGSHLAAQEVPMDYTARRLRHRHENTTRKYYIHVDIADQKAQLEKLKRAQGK